MKTGRLLLTHLFLITIISVIVDSQECVGELIVSPQVIHLSGRLSASQILVTSGLFDVTRDANYTVTPTGVIDVDSSGFVDPLADGHAVLLIEFQGEKTTIPVVVERVSVADPVDFECDVQAVLSRFSCNSGACHGKQRGQNGFQLSLLGFDSDFDYDSLVKDSRGRRHFSGAAEESLLLLKPTAQLPHGGGKRIERGSSEYQILLDWITAGMSRREKKTVTLMGISVEPSERVLTKLSKQQLRVTAKFSDGSTRDVTRMSAYLSNEPALVSVTQNGLLSAGTLVGDTAVMARYLGQISVCTLAVPDSDSIAGEFYTALPQYNFIDGHVWAKLQTLNLTPSDPCADHTFLRRVYLDIIGRGPTSDEARQFLDGCPSESQSTNDQVSHKESNLVLPVRGREADEERRSRVGAARQQWREALVDRLLANPEYAEHWANKWTDLLRPNPYHVGIKGTLAYDTWIRDAFRKNKPYDQFVRELITAQGSSFRNGNVVMFRDRRTPEDLTTIVSQLFLGVRLECARCHHHPFEVYGQTEFYSFAAYFAKIARKGDGISAPISPHEEFIFTRMEGGEVKHPLTQATMTPKPLFGKAPALDGTKDPRESLADWITSEENSFFGQVMANRVWADLMGRGLVDPVDDLRMTNPPSNAALLEALGDDFRLQGYDIKKLVRRIASSYVYGLSSLCNEHNAIDHRNFSRHYRQRLRAEVLLDTVCLATGVGETFDAMPAGSRAKELWTTRIDSLFLDAFGRQDPNQDPPCERTADTTIVQSLHLMNSNTLAKKLTSDGSRAEELAKSEKTPEQIVEDVYLGLYACRPNPEELQLGVGLFQEPDTSRRQAIEDLMWALINTPEFVFKD